MITSVSRIFNILCIKVKNWAFVIKGGSPGYLWELAFYCSLGYMWELAFYCSLGYMWELTFYCSPSYMWGLAFYCSPSYMWELAFYCSPSYMWGLTFYCSPSYMWELAFYCSPSYRWELAFYSQWKIVTWPRHFTKRGKLATSIFIDTCVYTRKVSGHICVLRVPILTLFLLSFSRFNFGLFLQCGFFLFRFSIHPIIKK
jgi:hypothetical protein